MADNKDYTTRTLEELLAEEKKLKRNEITAAVIIGFLIGIIIFGVAAGGIGLLFIFIPLFLIYLFTKNSKASKQNLKEVQEAIKAKQAV